MPRVPHEIREGNDYFHMTDIQKASRLGQRWDFWGNISGMLIMEAGKFKE